MEDPMTSGVHGKTLVSDALKSKKVTSDVLIKLPNAEAISFQNGVGGRIILEIAESSDELVKMLGHYDIIVQDPPVVPIREEPSKLYIIGPILTLFTVGTLFIVGLLVYDMHKFLNLAAVVLQTSNNSIESITATVEESIKNKSFINGPFWSFYSRGKK